MRKVASTDLDLAVEVDPSADPADWDQALAKFLLAFVRKQTTGSSETAEPEPVVLPFPSADERQ